MIVLSAYCLLSRLSELILKSGAGRPLGLSRSAIIFSAACHARLPGLAFSLLEPARLVRLAHSLSV